jgi:8-oxo-dGTP diphosphatase
MADELRQWTVAGGILAREGRVLLVQNQRRNGDVDWSPPGGVIDEGESAIEGLRREVEEETGFQVQAWSGPIYRIEVEAPGFGFFLRVEAHLALDFGGELRIDDPDGIVIGAEFVDAELARLRLDGAPRWVAEPVLDHVIDGVDDGRLYSYRLEGSGPEDRNVVRL